VPQSYTIGPLAATHDRSTFSCGVSELDRYLQRQASQDMRRNAARVFVLSNQQSGPVLGYYTLSASSVEIADLPPEVARRLPRYPVLPAALLGRLAVDARHQGQHLGQLLLFDSCERTWRVSQSDLAAVALLVDAKDEGAGRFYERHGFLPLTNRPQRLFASMTTIARMIAAAST
jgi:GNAT superfamily N-acetyltransferase